MPDIPSAPFVSRHDGRGNIRFFGSVTFLPSLDGGPPGISPDAGNLFSCRVAADNRVRLDDDHPCADRNPVIEIDHMIVDHPDAAI